MKKFLALFAHKPGLVLNSGVLLAVLLTVALAPLAASFSIDVDAIMAYASDMFNALMPIAAIGIGLSLGVAIIALLIRVVKGSVSNL